MKFSTTSKIHFMVFIPLLLFLCFNLSFAQWKDKLSKLNAEPNYEYHYSKVNINNISTIIYNYGSADLNIQGDSGFEFPKYSGKHVVYESGFIWGGKIIGYWGTTELRLSGSTYNTGLYPGRILSNGKGEDYNSEKVRTYRVRPDYKTADLSSEIQDEKKDFQTIYNQYEKDWNEWPAEHGAPFNDANKNGKYEPSVDVPGIPGADQTLWFVANDSDPIRSQRLVGTEGFGIEMQTTVWAYENNSPLDNMIFKKYILINKGKNKIDDMYIGIWCDPDVGDAADDLIGCDSLLNLNFCFNGDNYDRDYGTDIPAVGFKLLQGPVVIGNPTDSARFLGKNITEKKNLNMTAFAIPIIPAFSGNPGSYIANYYYNLLQGKHYSGIIIIDPFTGRQTKFPFSGDPVNSSGFLAGAFIKMSDQRMLLSSGSFNMVVGDTQEIIFAEIAAGGGKGESRFAGISLLKLASHFAQRFYDSEFSLQPFLNEEPKLRAVELEREIILNWGEDYEMIHKIENTKTKLYFFQGYNVYQVSKKQSNLGERKLIASFDLKDFKTSYYNEEVNPSTGYVNRTYKTFGRDSGIQRFISIKKDYLNNSPLNNGTDYDFGVTYFFTAEDLSYPYGYIESPMAVITVKPQSLKPGVSIEKKFGDVITVNHLSGNSISDVKAIVIDPLSLTGSEYEIKFRNESGRTLLTLTNLSNNKILLIDQANFPTENDLAITEGFVLRIKDDLSKPLSDKDVYRFRTTQASFSNEKALDDFDRINVFPNPYYGGGTNEFNKYDRHVTFSHLPEKAVLRIFNLASQLIRILEKNSPDQFLRWNMLTEENLQIPTGLYIAHIELPDFGKVKILKFAVITGIFLPDHY